MKPRLRPHVEITRQHYRGRRWHVVHDPASNQFYRLNPIAHDFVGMLDGSRDVETVWKLSLGKHADAAPTQNEVIQLISQLYTANLLSVDTTPETEQLLRRGRDRLGKKVKQQLIGIMYFKIRLFNPDRVLTALEPIFRPLIGPVGFCLWLAFVLFALVRNVIPNWQELASGVDTVMAPSNWGWLVVVFIVTKAIHETGHGLICKRFGGQVPEFGVMMLVMFPAPYVDASACWAFPSKWRRMAVGAGGMIFELTVAAACSFVWVSISETGDVLRQVMYNAMFTASLSTILFNANPLMRFDGYYMLADLLEVPNLAQRSNKMLQYLMQKFVFRLERTTAPSTIPAEQSILIIYGIASGIYRVFLFFSITLYVMGKFFAIGALLAVWTASAWFLLPVGALIHWLASSPILAEKRLRTIAITLLILAAGIIGVGAIPFPDYRRASGVVESMQRSGVYAGVDGFVELVHARIGDRVNEGDPLVSLASPELLSRRLAMQAQLDEYAVDERTARAKNDPAAAMIHAQRLAVVEKGLRDIDEKLDKLTIRAPQNGVVVSSDPRRLLGAYIKQGQEVCEIVDPTRIRIAASLDQLQSDWITELSPDQYQARIHSISYREKLPDSRSGHPDPTHANWLSDSERVIPIRHVTIIQNGQNVLPSPVLGYAGGGKIETDQQRDPQGRLAKRQRFTAYLDPALPTPVNDNQRIDGRYVGLPGEPVKVRFRLPDKPLFSQWIDRLIIRIKEGVNI
ncbi:MAG: PqqD family peptide modification chaperone [Phycisphaerales bacterium]